MNKVFVIILMSSILSIGQRIDNKIGESITHFPHTEFQLAVVLRNCYIVNLKFCELMHDSKSRKCFKWTKESSNVIGLLWWYSGNILCCCIQGLMTFVVMCCAFQRNKTLKNRQDSPFREDQKELKLPGQMIDHPKSIYKCLIPTKFQVSLIWASAKVVNSKTEYGYSLGFFERFFGMGTCLSRLISEKCGDITVERRL